jgi:hypothetical protein
LEKKNKTAKLGSGIKFSDGQYKTGVNRVAGQNPGNVFQIKSAMPKLVTTTTTKDYPYLPRRCVKKIKQNQANKNDHFYKV